MIEKRKLITVLLVIFIFLLILMGELGGEALPNDVMAGAPITPDSLIEVLIGVCIVLFGYHTLQKRLWLGFVTILAGMVIISL